MQLIVTNKTCLTPDSSEKSIYYLTLSLPDTCSESLDYEPGDWLTVQPCNRQELVKAILQCLALSGDEPIELRRVGEVNAYQALLHHLEITQLNPAILNKLQRQRQIGDWADRQAMIDYAYGRDILDLLHEFTELQNLGVEFLALLSPLAPRYYSIASANLDKQSVAILYRHVNYERQSRQRLGVATHHLTELSDLNCLEIDIKHNPTFKMPEHSQTPIIMIGAGTGLAPYIGFLQRREQQLEAGEKLGEALLFFGESSEAHHCLLCDQLMQWQALGIVENVMSFSRDQAHKVYVQHRLQEYAERIYALILAGAHLYICGSQTRLAVGVKDALLTIFQQQGGMDSEQAQSTWDALRKEKRLQQDVY